MDLAVAFRACVRLRVPAGQGRVILKASFATASQFRNNRVTY